MSKYRRTLISTILVLAFQLLACGDRGPAEIHYGQDQCDHCKMTIADKKFGSELVTVKGKVYKFDSIECLAAYHVTAGLGAGEIHSMWVTDFSQPGSFLNVERAAIIASERQKSPMGIGLVAVATPEQAIRLIEVVGGKIISWEQVRTLVTSDWHL
jgi:copper chaperone NosL